MGNEGKVVLTWRSQNGDDSFQLMVWVVALEHPNANIEMCGQGIALFIDATSCIIGHHLHREIPRNNAVVSGKGHITEISHRRGTIPGRKVVAITSPQICNLHSTRPRFCHSG